MNPKKIDPKKLGLKKLGLKTIDPKNQSLKKIDPILNAEIGTNTKKQLTRTKNSNVLRSRALNASGAVRRDIDNAWKPAVKAMRQMFRRQFSGPQWKELGIDFHHDGYVVNWSTCFVCAYVSYTARWKGIAMSRDFCPKNLVEVKVEALRLKDVLIAWNGGNGSAGGVL